MVKKSSLSASELGSLWLTYNEKTMIIAVLQHLIAKSDDQAALKIMQELQSNLIDQMKRVRQVFKDEGAALPLGFTDKDVNPDAPKLFDKGLDILIVLVLKETSMGLSTLNVNLSYREDVINIYRDLASITYKTFNDCTQYLIERGLLAKPPNIPMPESAQMVQNREFLSGLNPFKQKRPLTSIEVGYIHYAIESNHIGLQIITGFAQTSTNEEVKEYFKKGIGISEKIIKEMNQILLEENIPLSSAAGGMVTESKTPPFSERLMMMFIQFLNSFGIAGQSFGAVFSLRNDLVLKFALQAKNIYFYASEGIKIMIKNGWLEEPPQMADRTN